MEGATNAVVTAVNSMISTVSADVTSIITTNAPIIAGVVGAGVLLGVGLRFIKRFRSAA